MNGDLLDLNYSDGLDDGKTISGTMPRSNSEPS